MNGCKTKYALHPSSKSKKTNTNLLLIPRCQNLQTLTASDPLTLPEEYAMQRSWRQDRDKLTFIVCTAPLSQDAETPSTAEQMTPGQHDAPEHMIGDVNLFLYADVDSDSDVEEKKVGEEEENDNAHALVAELEIMIARPDARGKGLAHETLRAFLCYVSTELAAILAEYDGSSVSAAGKASWLKYLRVKIDKDNVRSIRLFERVGFLRTSEEANYFGEMELRMEDGAWRAVHRGGESGTVRKIGYGL